jgi:hypothetical protein
MSVSERVVHAPPFGVVVGSLFGTMNPFEKNNSITKFRKHPIAGPGQYENFRKHPIPGPGWCEFFKKYPM